MSVLRDDDDAGRRTSPTAWSRSPRPCPDEIAGFHLGGHGAEIFADERLVRLPSSYPAALWTQAGRRRPPNRAALATWGAWVNALAQAGVRPAAVHRVLGGPRRVDQHRRLRQGLRRRARAGAGTSATRTRDGALLPQQITEFTNSGLACGIATVNFAARPDERRSTASGARARPTARSRYLKYGPMRLFSQLAQDCELKVGKVLWVAGHSGPETAEDSPHPLRHLRAGRHAALPRRPRDRPAPVGAQRGAGAARPPRSRADAPIVALHLTRPAGRDPGPRGARHGLALRGGARRLRACATSARRAARRHRLRPGHDRPRPTWSRSCPQLDERGPQRQDRGRPSARSSSRCRTRRYRERDRVARRIAGTRMAITNRARSADARLDRRPARARVLAHRPTGTTAGAPAARSTR